MIINKERLNEEYFEWMVDLVCGDHHSRTPTYYRLLRYLNSRSFTYTLQMDGNRATDGIDLRYRFGYEKKYSSQLITDTIYDRPCTVLEMMVALAHKCEENIMDDPDIGNRTGKWFWAMIDNLGLTNMSDINYNERFVESVVTNFLKRNYSETGKGGLFIVKNPPKDIRTSEIWYQMMWYLEETSYI